MEIVFPINYQLPNNLLYKKLLTNGNKCQIIETSQGKALVAEQPLVDLWINAGYLTEENLYLFEFNSNRYSILLSEEHFILEFIGENLSGSVSYNDAISFAISFQRSRKIDEEVTLSSAIFIEKLSIILPTYNNDLENLTDDVIIGKWCTLGVNVSILNTKRVSELTLWSEADIRTIIKKSGLNINNSIENKEDSSVTLLKPFKLPGRPELEIFFNEHIIDFIKNKERYQTLGVSFPGAIILYGPPGSGKTFAVDKLIDFLKWPSYRVEASSVASPYIHETSKKIAEVFEEAIKNAPSILVIDEMEAFLSERDANAGKHTVEEIAEFLRRIPEATENEVLIIGMTNKIDMIDQAILRRGRFDHIIKVDYASYEEIRAIIDEAFSKIPVDNNINFDFYIDKLSNRPISDISFWIKESARISALHTKDKVDESSMREALEHLESMSVEQTVEKQMGFIKE